jgi:hypothetical protein
MVGVQVQYIPYGKLPALTLRRVDLVRTFLRKIVRTKLATDELMLYFTDSTYTST